MGVVGHGGQQITQPREAKMVRFFLTMKPAELEGFSSSADRDFFAVPVEVSPLHTNIQTGLLTVASPIQNTTYPVDPVHIKTTIKLTHKQRRAARVAPGSKPLA